MLASNMVIIQIMEDEMSGACSLDGRNEKYTKF
jgi:hypothetical protein